MPYKIFLPVTIEVVILKDLIKKSWAKLSKAVTYQDRLRFTLHMDMDIIIHLQPILYSVGTFQFHIETSTSLIEILHSFGAWKCFMAIEFEIKSKKC